MKGHDWKAGDVGMSRNGNIFLVVDNRREGNWRSAEEPKHLLIYLTLDGTRGVEPPKACGVRWRSVNFDNPEIDGVMNYLNDPEAARIKTFLFSLTDWAVENYKELLELADEKDEVK